MKLPNLKMPDLKLSDDQRLAVEALGKITLDFLRKLAITVCTIVTVIVLGLYLMVRFVHPDTHGTTADQTPAADSTQSQTAPAPAPTPSVSPDVQTAPSTPPGPPLQVTLAELDDAYSSNEVQADNQYLGRLLEVQGVVYQVTRNLWGAPEVWLVDGDGHQVIADFASGQDYKVSNLKAGDHVIIRCKGARKVMWPELDCSGD